jgi:hypothetical protein
VILWYVDVLVAISVLAGLLCIVVGLAGRSPADLTMGATALVELALVGQLIITIVTPIFGNAPTGSGLEFWIYLISAIFIPPLAVLWGLLERNRWSTVVLGVASLAVAVMAYRMYEIWFVQTA